MPAARVRELEQRLPGPTRGEGELESRFGHYAPVTHGPVPSAPHRPQPAGPEGVPAQRDASGGELMPAFRRVAS